MYKLITVKDNVRVPPTKFNMIIKDAIKESLQETIEGKIDPDIGIFLLVDNVIDFGEGKIKPEDGAIYYPAKYKVYVYKPELHEVLFGEVVDITEFGAFVRIGPIDALVHVSQIMDDKVDYDQKNTTIIGKRTKNKLKEGDIVRVRIVGVSMGKAKNKISLTMRQPFLGTFDWIKKDISSEKKIKERVKKWKHAKNVND